MNLKGSFCWVLMWSWMVLQGQEVSIEAINPDYNGKTIHTIVAWNPFITSLEYTASVICDENGKFEHQIELEVARVVQFEFGVYQAYLYMEPGYHYEVKLPPL